MAYNLRILKLKDHKKEWANALHSQYENHLKHKLHFAKVWIATWFIHSYSVFEISEMTKVNNSVEIDFFETAASCVG